MSRSVEDRIEWFKDNEPDRPGLCLRHTWEATAVPPVGLPDANAGAQYVQRHGKMRPKTMEPPRGAWVWYTSSTHGHVCLSLGDGLILSTDVKGKDVGRVPIVYPIAEWGHVYVGWSDWYGETFTVGEDEDMPLSDKDVERIAAAVWAHEIENRSTDPHGKQPARWYLSAILDRVKGRK